MMMYRYPCLFLCRNDTQEGDSWHIRAGMVVGNLKNDSLIIQEGVAIQEIYP